MRKKIDRDLVIVAATTIGVVGCVGSVIIGVVPAILLSAALFGYVIYESFSHDVADTQPPPASQAQSAKPRQRPPATPTPERQPALGVVREYIEPPAGVRQRANLAMQAAKHVPSAGRIRLFDLGILGTEAMGGDYVIRPYAVTNYQPRAILRFEVLDKRGQRLCVWEAEFAPTYYRSLIMPHALGRLRRADLTDGVVLNVIAPNQYGADPADRNHHIASITLTPAEFLRRVDYLQGIKSRMDDDGEIDAWSSHAAQHAPLLDLTLDELLHDEEQGNTTKSARHGRW